ncbi:MAG: phosphoglucosamine mutase [Gammaproteobacteria bacterium]|nr:phosphoglucosamine mutase [Gammaproteobacteria bacterium]MCW9030107.1 phosphoglucosamine mutase [Gammaproteobacteria bacterium]
MKKQFFGTDGIRGTVGTYPITPDFMLKLGWAAGRVLGTGKGSKILIGKDTRISGYMIESALEAGLSAAGVNVQLLGPMPTPAIAQLTRTLHAQAGIVISASHNPFADNGIKFFSAEGKKLSDEVENAIESVLQQELVCCESSVLGKASRINDAPGRYIEFCKNTFPTDLDLKSLKIVVDCANGATYHIAPKVFSELGAELISIGDSPDGMNINTGYGSTHPENLQKEVIKHKADLGIAFDGDGDRLIMVNHEGELVDGDQLLYVMAMAAYAKGKLKGGVVGTLMTNLGLEHAFKEHEIPFSRAGVGDRYVMEQLLKKNWCLGGESSGHLICLNQTTTGDGIVAALQVLAALVEQGKSLKELASGMKKYPMMLINVRVAEKPDLDNHTTIQAALARAEEALADTGRVLLRSSGTEPLVRVMVEGRDESQVEFVAKQLADMVKKSLC